MKILILFRHSESGWKSENGDDHERCLTDKGIEVAKKMGAYLSNIQSIPDLIISSTALRAKSTSELAKNEGRWDSGIRLESGIYGGNLSFLIKLAQSQDNHIDSICFTGHEPYFSSFISRVTNQENVYFPTASIAKINFMVSDWRNIDFCNAELDWLIKPQDLLDLK